MNPRGAIAGLLLLAAAGSAAADEPGDFDFYVLALSWSPSWCEAEGDREGAEQCDGDRPYAFVVHGLWPQRERGWPEYCDVDDRPSRREIDGILDLVPDPGLVRHQWRKHGACSGLDPAAYLDLLREARERIRIPPTLERLSAWTMVRPEAVEQAFRLANPGLGATSVAVTCDDRRLREVRICLTPDLDFTACPEVDRRACRRDQVVMPPVR